MSNEEYTALMVKLATIEQNVSDIPEIKQEMKEVSKLSQEAHYKAVETEKDLSTLQSNITWLWRTVGATIVSISAGILFKM